MLAHKEQHNILDKCQSLGLYQGIDQKTRIRHLHRGLTAPYLDPVKASDSTNPKDTFDGVVESYRSYMERHKENMKETKSTLRISAISTKSGNRNKDSTKKTGEKEDGYDPDKDYSKFQVAQRYYKAVEWNNLTKGQRNYLRSVSKSRKSKDKNTNRTLKLIETYLQKRNVDAVSSKGTKRSLPDKDTSTSETVTSDEEVIPKKKRTRITTKRK